LIPSASYLAAVSSACTIILHSAHSPTESFRSVITAHVLLLAVSVTEMRDHRGRRQKMSRPVRVTVDDVDAAENDRRLTRQFSRSCVINEQQHHGARTSTSPRNSVSEESPGHPMTSLSPEDDVIDDDRDNLVQMFQSFI